MSEATLVIVRADPKRRTHNHPDDVAIARAAAPSPPAWIVLLGAIGKISKAKDTTTVRAGEREARLSRIGKALGLEGAVIARRGVSVFAPLELIGEDTPAQAAGALARYLVDRGIRTALRQSQHLHICVAADLGPVLLAAVVEAIAVFPRVDIRVGDEHLEASLRWETRRDLFRAPPPENVGRDLIGDSSAISKVRGKIERYAEQPFPVLVVGETGTGKEIVARRLHELSARQGRFMPQNAAQLPAELADSLLFGHRKGAFTGADAHRPGRIRETEGGTFFLDETFNLAPSVQAKLLRALNRVNEGIILVESVGSTTEEVIRARLVTSALSDPRASDSVSGMRMDLFYRIAVGIIRLPPLRQTLDDLPALCEGLLDRRGRTLEVTPDGIERLRDYDWPGNVRELELILLRAIMDAPKTVTRLDADHIAAALRTNQLAPGARSLALPCDLALELKRIEVATLRAAMREAGHVQAKAGRRVGMKPPNLRNFGRRRLKAEARLQEMEASGEDEE